MISFHPALAPVDVLRAAVQLRQHPDFETIFKYISEVAKDETEILVNVDLASIAVQQGRVKVLCQFVELFDNAQKYLKSRASQGKVMPI